MGVTPRILVVRTGYTSDRGEEYYAVLPSPSFDHAILFVLEFGYCVMILEPEGYIRSRIFGCRGTNNRFFLSFAGSGCLI